MPKRIKKQQNERYTMNMKIFALPLLALGLWANGTFAMDESANRVQELRRNNPGIAAEDASTWEKLLEIDPNMTIGDLQSSIHSFNHKMNQRYELGISYNAQEKDFVISAAGFRACKRYLGFANGSHEQYFLSTVTTVIGLYLMDCTHLKKYEEAYQVGLFMLDNCQEDLKNYNIISEGQALDGRMNGLVQAFSDYEDVEPQKLKEFESFLIGKGEKARRHLIGLYSARKMHQELVDFYSMNQAELLNLDSIRSHWNDILLSCLSCKRADLVQDILPLITYPTAKYLSQALTDMAMGDQQKALNCLTEFERFLEENKGKMKPTGVVYCDFIIKLLKKDINGAIALFANIPVGQPPLDQSTFANLIYLKEKIGASEIEIQEMKKQHQEIFDEPYSTYRLDNLGTMIDLVFSF